MPQCPNCNAAVWVGQQYCSTCDSPLPPGEEEKGYFCPECGGRMASPQETCQRCQTTQPEIAGIPITAPVRARRLPFRIPRIFIGGGLIIAAMFLIFFFHKSPEPSRVMVPPPSPVVSEQPPPAAPVPAAEKAPTAPTVTAPEKATSPPTVVAVHELAIPAATAASSPSEVAAPTASLPKYFVNIDGLYLREGPNMGAPQIATLKFKAQVELLDTSGGWGKVRDTERDLVGWSYMRYLQPVAPDAPRAVSGHEASDLREPESLSAKASPNM
jgi:predicted RNA-binding Zn-ribbon protein involved in translation (DUF1610 family)